MMRRARYLFKLCCSHYSSSTGKKPPISQKVKFIDQLRVVARGGHGGGGSSALFGRTGHHPRAAGGNGAPGGAVILRATKQLTGLGCIPLHVEAARGGSGGKQWMDGKKGPDRVVHVPLGTLVYQLLEVRGIKGSSTPYGVTSMPHAVQPNSRPGSQPGSFTAGVGAAQPAAAAAAAAAEVAADSAGGLAAEQQQQQVMQPLYWPASSGSSTSGPNRRRLFQELEEQQQQQQLEVVPAATAAVSATGEQDSRQQSADGRSSSFSESSRPSLQVHAAAAAAVDSLEPDVGDDDGDALYQQLVSCQRLLTDAEKQALLHTGRLPSPAAAAAAAAGVDGADHKAQHAAEAEEHEGQGSDGDAALSSEASSGEEDDWTKDDEGWMVYKGSGGGEAGVGGEAWPGAGAAGGDGWQEVDRQFTKQQVWSILESQAVLLGELDQEGQAITVAGGGRGGRGNGVSPSRPQAPASRVRSDGQHGQELLLLLKLRLLADVVLVGLPNVGKSSLIAALTHARAQVGSYAFTTLRPQLGTITDTTPLHDSTTSLDASATPHNGSSPGALADAAPSPAAAAAATAAAGGRLVGDTDGAAGRAGLVLADLPGLVPGAHAGKGRGTAFLAHLQRARCLALVLDMTGSEGQEGQQQGQSTEQVQRPAAGADSGLAGGAGAGVGDGGSVEGWGALVLYTPRQQLAILLEELGRYDTRVLQLPMVVIANKLDALPPSAANAALQDLKAATPLPIVPVSAKEGLGLQRLKSALQLLVGR